MRSVSSFRLEARPSRGYRLGLIALAIAVALTLAWTALPVAATSAAAVIAAISLSLAWRHHRRVLPSVLNLRSDGQCTWLDVDDGRERQARVVEAAVLGPLIALTLTPVEGGSLRLAYWSDMLAPEAWRGLRAVARGLRVGAEDSHGV